MRVAPRYLDKMFRFCRCAPCTSCVECDANEGQERCRLGKRPLIITHIHMHIRVGTGVLNTRHGQRTREIVETHPLSPRLSPQAAHMAWPARGIARDRREMQLLRSGLWRSSLPEHLHHLGRSIAAIARVQQVLCVGHDKASRPFSWMQSWSNADESFGQVREGRV